MRDLLSWFVTAGPALTLLTLAMMALPLTPPATRPATLWGDLGYRWYRLSYLIVLAFSLLLLSACGTAPLQAVPCPPVPADLMTLPQEPVLLQRN